MADAAGAVAMAAHGLRPQAEGAARLAAASGIDRDIGMLEIADEIVLDLQVALVDRRDEGQRVHVLEDRPRPRCGGWRRRRRASDSPTMSVQILAVGDFLDGEIEFIAGDEIERRARLSGCRRRSTATLAPIRPTLSFGLAALSASMHFTSEAKDGAEVCRTDQIEILGLRDDLGELVLCGGASISLAVLDQRGGLGQPGRIPERARFRAAPDSASRRRRRNRRRKAPEERECAFGPAPPKLSNVSKNVCATKPRNRGHSVAPWSSSTAT